MTLESNSSDALAIRNKMASAFKIAAADGVSTAASKSSVQSLFRSGISMVKNGTAAQPKDAVLIGSIRSFANSDEANRVLTVRNLFLKAIVMTFPNIRLDSALYMAGIKALVTPRESGGCVSWALEGGGGGYVAGKTSGTSNMKANQTYGNRNSGTGLIQWTASRQKNFLNRMSTLDGMGFSKELAFIDPGYQAMYWAAELAESAGINKEINGSAQTAGAHFSKAFADVLLGKADAQVGEIYGAFMLWQMGGGFGGDNVGKRNALIYGARDFSGPSTAGYVGGITHYDLNKASELGLNGYFPPAATLTVNQFCNGISKFVRAKSYGYPAKASFFWKGFKKDPVSKKSVRNVFLVQPETDLLSIFNLK